MPNIDCIHLILRCHLLYVLLCSPKTSLRAGGTHLSVLARGLASYLHVSLDSKEVERIGRVLSQQTSQWIINMMKWVCTSGHCHIYIVYVATLPRIVLWGGAFLYKTYTLKKSTDWINEVNSELRINFLDSQGGEFVMGAKKSPCRPPPPSLKGALTY